MFPLSNAAGLHFGILFLSNGTCYLNSSIAFECCKLLGNKLMKLRFSVYLKLFYMSFHQVRMMLIKSSPLLCFWLFLSSAAALCLLSSCCFFAKSPLSSPLLCFVDDEIVQVHTLYGIWADDQELMRNLVSLPAAPTLPSPLFSVMMPWCSKFKIRWWLTCFWGLYHCYYSFFIYNLSL